MGLARFGERPRLSAAAQASRAFPGPHTKGVSDVAAASPQATFALEETVEGRRPHPRSLLVLYQLYPAVVV